MTVMTMVEALNSGLRAALDDPSVLLMGEDIGRLGGVFRVTDGLLKDFGDDRVLDTPLAESGIVGTAIGLALCGFRPVVEIQFDGFVFPAANQIITQAAKISARSQGRLRVPLVIRIPYGGGIGAVEHHSESPESYFVHTAGLRVVTCSDPADAYWMIQQSVHSDDPVILFEPKRRYWDRGDVDVSAPRAGLYAARTVREGTDCTLVAYGPTVRTCLEAADAAAESGVSVEVLDLRSLSPLDTAAVRAAALRTGRLAVVHEAGTVLGMGAEVAARITEECFFDLEAPVIRVGGPHVPYPPARLEHAFLPDTDRVVDAIDRLLRY
jgi:2-oxoisovalerate dehydrogenase E1 component beta subunit